MYGDNQEAEFEIRRHLDAGEKLLWCGKPKGGIMLQKSDVFMIPFSLMWGGFAFFWEFMVLSNGIYIFGLFGLPFVAVGTYLIIGRFFFDASRRNNTIYAITDNRIIIKSGVFKKNIKSLDLGTITNLSVDETDDDSGTVVLGAEMPFMGQFRGTSWPTGSKSMTPALEQIKEVRKVYRLIVEAQKAVN